MKPQNTTIESRIIDTRSVNWREFSYIQQDTFKELGKEAKDRLKASMLQNQFSDPFKVWEDPASGIVYCLDGRHRTLILEELSQEGFTVPYTLPATFMQCENRADGARLVLLYSSQYARITKQGFEDFVSMYQLDPEDLKMDILIPGINDMQEYQPEILPFPEELTADPKEKPAVMRITFPTAEQLESAKPIIEGILDERAPGYLISVSAGEI